MILELVPKDNPLLHKPAKKITNFSEVKGLIKDMEETLLFTGGIGLAAPQIGSPHQICVLNIPPFPKIYINPVITEYSKEVVEMEEGCLSIPGYRGDVPRAIAVTVEYYDKTGKKKVIHATKLLAHALQHETDHLNGILYPDRMIDMSKMYKVIPFRIVFFGTPEFGVPTLLRLISLKHSFEYEVVGVVTQNTNSPIAKAAQEFQTRVIPYPPKGQVLKDPTFMKTIEDLKPDIFVVASFGRILPQALLTLPRFGALNVHVSILPKYRGASPVPTAIVNGEQTTGLTIQLMHAEMDKGDIVAQQEMVIDPQDTGESLLKRLSSIAPKLVLNAMHAWINKRVKPQPQDETQATYTKLLTKEDGYIDATKPPKNIERMIRAYYPWPGVWTKLPNGKILKLLPNHRVQVEGKKPILLTEFKQGYPHFTLTW